jgi:hypothetical protein
VWDNPIFDSNGVTWLKDFLMMGGADGPNRIAIFSENQRPSTDPVSASDKYDLTTSGWYTFQQNFFDDGGLLADRTTLLQNGTVLKSWLLSTTLNTTQLGGKATGWFAGLDRTVAIDNAYLTTATPEPGTFLLLLGLAPVLCAARKRLL